MWSRRQTPTQNSTYQQCLARLALSQPNERAQTFADQIPFIALNCGSLPDTLIEAELFGHERGAFTGAQSARQGLAAQAEGGTLFLDAVDTLPPKAQVGILRLAQDKCYRALGSSKEHRADIRILAETNTLLLALAES